MSKAAKQYQQKQQWHTSGVSKGLIRITKKQQYHASGVSKGDKQDRQIKQ